MAERAPLRIAVLASGEGTTFEALAKEFAGSAHVQPVLVITNKSKAGIIKRAKRFGVKTIVLPSKNVEEEVHEQQIMDALAAAKPDLVVLAGWLRQIGPRLVQEYAGRMINTHPALLPRHGGKGMHGDSVHAAVIAAGDTASGVSVHFVDEHFDTGRRLAQAVVPVSKGDTLETLKKRVQKAEKSLLVRAIWNFALKR